MIAVHVDSLVSTGFEYKRPCWDMLMTVVSALLWKKYNGDIKIYLDSKSYEIYKYYNVLWLYDKVDVGTLDKYYNSGKCVDWKQFWALPKLIALKNEGCGSVMLDRDLFVWKNVVDSFIKNIVVSHKEKVDSIHYKDPNILSKPVDYSFRGSLDLKAEACNTSLLYINHKTLFKDYIDQVFKFVEGNTVVSDENNYHMVFVEQHLLGILVKYHKCGIQELCRENDLTNQDMFYHVWGYKNVLYNDPIKAKEFTLKLLNILYDEFPEYVDKLKVLIRKANFLG